MIVCRTQHGELVRNVRGPSRRIMVGDPGLQRLPGSDDGLLGCVFWLVRNRSARVLAVGHAGAVRASLLTAEGDLVVDEQAPGGTALDPKTKNMDVIAIGHDGFHLTACLANLVRTGF